MVVWNALEKWIGTLGGSVVVAVLALGLAAPAEAGVISGDPTECVTRTSNTSSRDNDLIEGNYWARLDTFALDQESCFFGASYTGVGILIKTPWEIDSNPDIDDADSLADVSVLIGQVETDFPDYEHHGFNVIAEGGGGGPAPSSATFVSVGICIYVGGGGSIDDCLTSGPLILSDLGGGMEYFADLGGDSFFLHDDGDTEFQMVTVLVSNLFGEQIGNDVPEGITGFLFVPEPSVLALLAPAAGLLAARRRRARA